MPPGPSTPRPALPSGMPQLLPTLPEPTVPRLAWAAGARRRAPGTRYVGKPAAPRHRARRMWCIAPSRACAGGRGARSVGHGHRCPSAARDAQRTHRGAGRAPPSPPAHPAPQSCVACSRRCGVSQHPPPAAGCRRRLHRLVAAPGASASERCDRRSTTPLDADGDEQRPAARTRHAVPGSRLVIKCPVPPAICQIAPGPINSRVCRFVELENPPKQGQQGRG